MECVLSVCEVCRDVVIKPFFNVIQCDFIFDPSKATRYFDWSVDRSCLARQIPRIVNCLLPSQNLDLLPTIERWDPTGMAVFGMG